MVPFIYILLIISIDKVLVLLLCVTMFTGEDVYNHKRIIYTAVNLLYPIHYFQPYPLCDQGGS